MDNVSISKVTAKQLRNMERAVYNKKEPCHVCGGKNSVTVLHHLLPLERVAELINAGLCEINISRKAVWLCPTCHAYVHKYIREVNKGHSLKDVADKYYKETLYAYKIGLLVCESHKEEQKILQEKIKLFELLEGTEAVQ